MTRRSSPNLTEQLAAALLQVEGCPELYEHAKAMTAHQIVSLFHRDHHPVRVCDQEALDAAGIRYINHPCNLTWRLIAAHRRKTAKVDQPSIAKAKRIRQRFERIFELYQRNELRSKPFLRSRPFDSRYTRGMDGKVRPRKRRSKMDSRHG